MHPTILLHPVSEERRTMYASLRKRNWPVAGDGVGCDACWATVRGRPDLCLQTYVRTCTHTHAHAHAHTSTYPHTHTPTYPHTQTGKETERQRGGTVAGAAEARAVGAVASLGATEGRVGWAATTHERARAAWANDTPSLPNPHHCLRCPSPRPPFRDPMAAAATPGRAHTHTYASAAR